LSLQYRDKPGWLNIRGGRDIQSLDKPNSMPGMLCQTTELQSGSSKSITAAATIEGRDYAALRVQLDDENMASILKEVLARKLP
jgi:hypothetical protein